MTFVKNRNPFDIPSNMSIRAPIMDNITNVIDKVKKLLALSKSSNANEAAAAAAAANKLIDQFRLDEADLEVQNTAPSEPVEEDQDFVYETGRINPWKWGLLSTLSRHYGLACWNDATYQSGRKFTRIRLIGRRSDITIARYMFAWLTSECQRLSDAEAKGRGHIFANSYCLGFVRGIAKQLQLSRNEVAQKATSAAMVKVDARQEEAARAMAQLHPNLVHSKGGSSSRLHGEAYDAGYTRGESFHLGNSLSGGAGNLLNR